MTCILALLCITWLAFTSETCDHNSTCKERVVAEDMSDLDGCGIMLMTEDHRKLLPVNLEEFPFEVSDGDQLMVSYETIKDGMSICMAEDAMVKVNCLEQFPLISEQTNCPPMTDPIDFSWSKQIVQEIELRRVERITTDAGDYYWFIATEECRLHKCTGEVICIGTCDEKDECEAYFASHNIAVSDSRVIYVQDN